jgi:NUMOD3 motif
MKNIVNFYVYAYLREDQTPYYIGKGKGKRAWENNHGVNLPEESRIIMIETNLSQQEAFELEIKLIEQYGRKDLGTGILRNRTNGGEGTAGLKQTDEHKEKISKALTGIVRGPHTEEHKKNLSKILTGRAKSEETKLKLSEAHNKKSNPVGVKRLDETKQRMRQSQLGKTHTAETRALMSVQRKGRPSPNKGKVMSAETKQKIRDTKRKKYEQTTI